MKRGGSKLSICKRTSFADALQVKNKRILSCRTHNITYSRAFDREYSVTCSDGKLIFVQSNRWSGLHFIFFTHLQGAVIIDPNVDRLEILQLGSRKRKKHFGSGR